MPKVEEYMTDEVVAATINETISHVRNLLLKHNISRVIVLQDGKPKGIVTKKDVLRRLASGGAPWKRRPLDKITISRVMTPGLITIPPEADVKAAAKLMLKENISSLPVVGSNTLYGILTKTDLLRAYREHYQGAFRTRELMTRKVITANRHHTLSHIAALMMEKGIGRVVIVDGQKPIGIVTASDLFFVNLEDYKRGISKKRVTYVKPKVATRPQYRYVQTFPLVVAEDFMATTLITTTQASDAAEASSVMLEEGISSLPVVEEDELGGIITKTDIVRGMTSQKRGR
ncbi:MAG: CBS domain-containing protein [Candidatus Hydrothermarchaeota archaeon]